MKRTLYLSLIGLLLMSLPSFAADAKSTSTQVITNKVKPVLSPIKNKKLLDAAKNLNASGATSDATSDNSGSNTAVPETYAIAIENPTLVQDPSTCGYVWTVRIRNSGTTPIPDGKLSVVAQAIKPDYSYVGLQNTIRLGAIQPGAFYPVSSGIVEKPAEASGFIIGVQKGADNLGSVNYPFTSVAACNSSQ